MTRLERGLGTLNNGQRDALRQGAESFARDRRAANGDAQVIAGAAAQFDRLAQGALTPAQYEQYQANKNYYLLAQGPNPTKGQPKTSTTAVATMVNRFEQGLGGLNNGQRDAIRQLAETYVRDYTAAQQNPQLIEGTVAQFERGLRDAISPAQFSTYESNKSYYLNGKAGQGGRGGKGGLRRGR
ncbi:hypothetical protein [Hymenobacter metallicola]|uniref:Uncharacterized protein n=1 Tax=Hymenobacter metallicola TaxID=2563114 RepID=A0A4Z0QHL6_9BACT|nr:hypothetical protein [Hymenobacter metallicola]TGE29568.1 hypothetical protein E5K02_08965 [Hymenobacter metallicola]